MLRDQTEMGRRFHKALNALSVRNWKLRLRDLGARGKKDLP